MIRVDLEREFPRKFLSRAADMGVWTDVEPAFTELLARHPASAQALEQWLADRDELSAALSEEEAKRYIAMTTQTDDPVREAGYQHFVEQIAPKSKPLAQASDKSFLENPHREGLSADRYTVLNRKLANSAALFRIENVPLETRDELLAQKYQKLMGAMTVSIDGRELTLQQASKLLERTDRGLRQITWESMAARQLLDKEALEQTFDDLVALRAETAANAGFANFRDYAFMKLERFDYTPEDCYRFHDAVESTVMPLVHKIRSRRRRLLNADKLRPWDLSVDPLGRPPLSPFSTTAEFVQGAKKIFGRIDPGFREQFQFMIDRELLDLENRKGKAPGGYQSSLQERRFPFIFMNAVGRDSDLRTLVHEGGHAFHMLATRDEPLLEYRHAPMEFCEVASMGMELLALPHLDVFYENQEDYRRAYRARLEDLVLLFPSIALGDAFQHWIYTHPRHTREERGRAWIDLANRFTALVDWTGYEEQRTFHWHGILHFFAGPFYYIEYGIAQIGALQVWMNSLKNYGDAVERYWQALSLGGSRPLPDLFAAAGGEFRFDGAALKPLMDTIGEKLDELGS